MADDIMIAANQREIANNSGRFLITTEDERSWRFDRPVLFLGEWCCWHDKRKLWEGHDVQVVSSYGWNEGQRARDCAYVNSTYEHLLGEVSSVLNQYHGTNHSTRYWRILLGTWLHRFTTITFNRWQAVQYALNNYKVSGTTVVDTPKEQLVPVDYIGFAKLFRVGDWDHAIYGRILSEWSDIPCEVVANDSPSRERMRKFTIEPSCTNGLKQRLKRYAIKTSAILARLTTRKTDALIVSPCLPLKYDFQLRLMVGQVPLPRYTPATPNVKPEMSIRREIKLKNGCLGFEQFIRTIIPEQIPTCYLEGYPALQAAVKGLHWPKKPKFIFTANSFDTDEVFKVWTAEKVEEGIPYIIGQHGANYGTSEYAPSELHELATTDRYLTWGWKDGSDKQYPAVALSAVALTPGRWDKEGGLLLVERGGGHRETPWDETTIFKNYLNEQFEFVNELSQHIKGRLTVRLYAANYFQSWSEKMIWNENCPSVTVNVGGGPLGKLVSQHRLSIYTYDSSGVLESFARKIPAILFWNTEHWPLRETAKPYFDVLRNAGIFHDSPQSAAMKINEIWGNVENWWNSDEVKAARDIFCNRFVRIPNKPMRELKRALVSKSV
jgi:putative transferase (TIGR04331 family)